MSARLVVALALLAAVTCAGTKPRAAVTRGGRPGCALTIYHTPMPEAVAWDDIGVLEVGCYLDESEVTCLHRLRTEACRMGGDMIYGVPKRALRPTERAMVYRGMVAHTREAPPKPDDDKHAEAPHPLTPAPARRPAAARRRRGHGRPRPPTAAATAQSERSEADHVA